MSNFAVPDAIRDLVARKETSLHKLSIDAGVTYSTAHAWAKGTATPNVESFNHFLNVHGYELSVRPLSETE